MTRGALLLLTFLLALAAPANAATFNVNSPADEPDADTSVAACATAGGACTLRAAIDQANADTSDSTINLPAGTYTLTGADGEDANDSGDLDLNSRGFVITITGAGARTTVINGDTNDRVLHVLTRSELVVQGVTITGGLANDGLSDGGGIYMDGGSTATSLTVTNSTIRGNRADSAFFIGHDGDGGGIHTGEDSQVSISGTTITGNTAVDDGGGIENDAANLSIVNSTIHGNTAEGEGSDDAAGDELGSGGGIEHNEGQMAVVHTTITDNIADNHGGGVNVERETDQQAVPPTATFRSTILSGNVAPTTGPNCRTVAPGTLTSAGTNLESGSDCGFAAAGNIQGANPLLGPLANNGGQTDTRALAPNSPALNRATTAPCPAMDQRGVTRPQGSACDIGAYEREFRADTGVVIGDSPDPVTAGRNVTYTVLGGNGGPDTASNTRVTVDLPPGVDLRSSTISGGGSCTGGTSLTCNLGNLASGERKQITVVVRTSAEDSGSSAARAAQAGGTLQVSARITATEPDPDSANNVASTTTSIDGADEDDEGDDEAGGGGGGDVAGASADDGELAFTGLPLALVITAGAWMLGAGLTLRRLDRFVD